MEKQLLLKNILIELNQLPEVYLKHWYELIQTFREKLPVQENIPSSSKEPDFDWDAFVKEAMANRSKNNSQRVKRMETLLND